MTAPDSSQPFSHPAALAYWCDRTSTTPGGEDATTARDMIAWMPVPDRPHLLRLAADLYSHQPGALRDLSLTPVDYIQVVLYLQEEDPALIYGPAQRVRQGFLGHAPSASAAARDILTRVTPGGLSIPPSGTLSDRDIKAVRIYGATDGLGYSFFTAGRLADPDHDSDVWLIYVGRPDDTITEPAWSVGDPVWWQPSNDAWFSGTVLHHDPDQRHYLVTLHDHPQWRWVEHVPGGQLADRDQTPELIVTTETGSGLTVTTWTCPWPGHEYSTMSAYTSNVRVARAGCARYMPPLGHAHDTPLPAGLLPEGIDPDTVPVWVGGVATVEPVSPMDEGRQM